MKIDTAKLGAGLLATSPLLLNLGGERWLWWLGVIMAVISPFLMSLKSH